MFPNDGCSPLAGSPAWRRSGWIVACGLLLSLLAGCRPAIETGQVHGMVTQNGAPAAQILVALEPMQASALDGQPPAGVTDDTGSFTLTYAGTQNIPAGPYRVILDDLEIYEQPRTEDRPQAAQPIPSRVPQAYRSASQSPLRCDVRQGSQNLNLEIPAPQS